MEQLILITTNKLIVSKRGNVVAHIDKYIVSVKYLKRSFSKASAGGNENFFDYLFLRRANLNQIDL